LVYDKKLEVSKGLMTEESLKIRISRKAVLRAASELGMLAEGQSKPVKLPPERELAEKFQLSRRGIRLAVEVLERKGLLVRKHGSGNYLLGKKFSLGSAYLFIPGELKVEDPFYSSLIGQLMMYGREHQIQMVPMRVEGEMVLNKEWPGILLGKVPGERLARLAGEVVTLVAMADLETEVCCQIFYDDFGIGQEAARRLAWLGHRRVLMLAGPGEQYASARQRLAGFTVEAGRVGLEVTVREGKMNWRGGYELMKGFLQEGGRRVSGVFASNDWMAAGALQAMAEGGVKVPEDISLIGCDDVPLASELSPGLATFRLDVGQFVEQTFTTLEQAWRLQLPKKIVLAARFIERESIKRIVLSA
jgi:DNA-binding LacI/PurR family transcriptional regulator